MNSFETVTATGEPVTIDMEISYVPVWANITFGVLIAVVLIGFLYFFLNKKKAHGDTVNPKLTLWLTLGLLVLIPVLTVMVVPSVLGSLAKSTTVETLKVMVTTPAQISELGVEVDASPLKGIVSDKVLVITDGTGNFAAFPALASGVTLTIPNYFHDLNNWNRSSTVTSMTVSY